MFEFFLKPDNLLKLDETVLLILGILVFLGIVFFVVGIKRFFAGRFITASIQSLSGISLILASLLLLSIAINLYSYERLTYEQPVAELSFNKIGDQNYQTTITYPSKNSIDEFNIKGDEWQIDARVIKWHGWAQLLGLDAQYRLERISGRYSDVEEELNKNRTVYSLSPGDEIDYWKLINQYKEYIPWIDTYYGSAVYLPMYDGAKYSVSLTQSGLIARAIDIKTDEKNKFW